MQQVILLELNEVNFGAVRDYGQQGKLPVLNRIIAENGLSETTSETEYEYLEPWIQWVTAHTGLSFAEHNVYRLGDIEDQDIEQIWEQLEATGVSVGAISPMNARNRTQRARFFIPDPWTKTAITGSRLLKKMYVAISQAVNDNATSAVNASSLFWLFLGAFVYARPSNYLQYLSLLFRAKSHPWSKAILLDLMLADVFIVLTKRKSPQFSSLFVNAGAHIQHHYMFNSTVYTGTQKNPKWYVSAGEDPVYDVYKMYDRIVGDVQKAFPNARLMIATGLHQDPHTQVTYYWRLNNYSQFLRKIGAGFERVLPRMSRDFLIECANEDQALETQYVLESALAFDGVGLFEVDNRGRDLFVMLTYPHEIGASFKYGIGDNEYSCFAQDVAFVAIKNGQHNGIGYFLDSAVSADKATAIFSLAGLPRIIKAAFADQDV